MLMMEKSAIFQCKRIEYIPTAYYYNLQFQYNFVQTKTILYSLSKSDIRV